MPLFNPPLQSTQAYTLSNVTPNRAFDPTTATSGITNQTIGTILTDLRAAGIIK